MNQLKMETRKQILSLPNIHKVLKRAYLDQKDKRLDKQFLTRQWLKTQQSGGIDDRKRRAPGTEFSSEDIKNFKGLSIDVDSSRKTAHFQNICGKNLITLTKSLMMDPETFGCAVFPSLVQFLSTIILMNFLYVLPQRVCDVEENNEQIEETNLDIVDVTENSAFQLSYFTQISESHGEASRDTKECKSKVYCATNTRVLSSYFLKWLSCRKIPTKSDNDHQTHIFSTVIPPLFSCIVKVSCLAVT